MPGAEPPKKWLKTLLLALFTGMFGLYRYYVGKTGTGFLWMITLGLLGIGWITDVIKILSGKFTDKQKRPLVK
ncbi:MAG: TM2 domain-containing protein [Clostridia bacterium]|nr:TM2 domain-containing protein [Clostridia bacterium]